MPTRSDDGPSRIWVVDAAPVKEWPKESLPAAVNKLVDDYAALSASKNREDQIKARDTNQEVHDAVITCAKERGIELTEPEVTSILTIRINQKLQENRTL